jgi:hypothetical protein
MTISFSCPSCEHSLKVKDELAGRKVKCPSCGGGVAVPAGEEDEEEAAAATARPSRQAREEPDEEERPRKKKKKKKKGNKGLLIGLGIGAVALVAVAIVLVIVLNQPKSQPDKGKVAENPPPKQNPVQQPAPQPHPEERGVGIRATMDRQEVKNDMRQIGLFYNQYRTLNNRGPADVKSFVDFFRRDAANIAEKFDKGLYDMFLVRNPDSNTVVAYEVPGESSGFHIVVFGDGHVDDISRQELQAMWKKHNKK